MLTRLYRDEAKGDAKYGIAAAISVAADGDALDELIALLRDQRLGPSRILLLRALERSKDPRARAALMKLGSDPELNKQIDAILHRLKKRKR